MCGMQGHDIMRPSMIRTPSAPDLTRVTLSVLVIGLLVVACLWILWPFLGAIAWAGMLVVATWPILLSLQAWLGGRRWLAILVLTFAMLLVIVLPLVLAVGTIAAHAGDMTGWIVSATHAAPPAPPAWVAQIPLVGS